MDDESGQPLPDISPSTHGVLDRYGVSAPAETPPPSATNGSNLRVASGASALFQAELAEREEAERQRPAFVSGVDVNDSPSPEKLRRYEATRKLDRDRDAIERAMSGSRERELSDPLRRETVERQRIQLREQDSKPSYHQQRLAGLRERGLS